MTNNTISIEWKKILFASNFYPIQIDEFFVKAVDCQGRQFYCQGRQFRGQERH